jgi:hypothetical protein
MAGPINIRTHRLTGGQHFRSREFVIGAEIGSFAASSYLYWTARSDFSAQFGGPKGWRRVALTHTLHSAILCVCDTHNEQLPPLENQARVSILFWER